MKDFIIMRNWVGMANRLTDSVHKVFGVETDEPNLTRHEIVEVEVENEEIEALFWEQPITTDEDPEDSLISELLGLSLGLADLQTTYEEWMQEVRKIRLPSASFYEYRESVYNESGYIDKRFHDPNLGEYWKERSYSWRVACKLRDKCAALGVAIAKLKEKYKLYDKVYLGDITKPRPVFTGVLGPGYERTPHSYDEELVELAVLNGQDRAAAEATIMRGQNRTAAAKTKGKSLPTKEVAFPVLEKYMMVRPEYIGKTMHELLDDWDTLGSVKLRKATVNKYLTWRRDIPQTCTLFGLNGFIQGELLYEAFGSASPDSFRKS